MIALTAAGVCILATGIILGSFLPFHLYIQWEEKTKQLPYNEEIYEENWEGNVLREAKVSDIIGASLLPSNEKEFGAFETLLREIELLKSILLQQRKNKK